MTDVGEHQGEKQTLVIKDKQAMQAIEMDQPPTNEPKNKKKKKRSINSRQE